MKSDGFVLMVCLCFIAMVSSIALSALLIGLLSQKIGIAGQQQLQQLQLAKSLHLQETGMDPDVAVAGDVAVCPAEFAVWTEPATRCHWRTVTNQHAHLTAWSSLLVIAEMTLPQEAL